MFIRLFSFLILMLISPLSAQEIAPNLPTQSFNVPKNCATGIAFFFSTLNREAALRKRATIWDVANRSYNRIRGDIYAYNPCQRIRVNFVMNKLTGRLKHLYVSGVPFERESSINLSYPVAYTASIKYSEKHEDLLTSSEEIIVGTGPVYVYEEFDCDSSIISKLVRASSTRSTETLFILSESLKSSTDDFEDLKDAVTNESEQEIKAIERNIQKNAHNKNNCEKAKNEIRKDISSINDDINRSKRRLSRLEKEVREWDRKLKSSNALIQWENRRNEAYQRLQAEKRVLSSLRSRLNELNTTLKEFNCESYDRNLEGSHRAKNRIIAERDGKQERLDNLVEHYERYLNLIDQLRLSEISVYQTYRLSLIDEDCFERAEDMNERYKELLESLLRNEITGNAIRSAGYVEDPIENYKRLLPIIE